MKPLDRLKMLLEESGAAGVTARKLAALMKCSVPAVYRRLERLKQDGVHIAETKAWSKNTGPVPRKFSLESGSVRPSI